LKPTSILTKPNSTEDCRLVVFNEAPGDTLVLLPIWRIKEANKIFVYLRQVVEEKDSLVILVNTYKRLDFKRQNTIKELENQNIRLNDDYHQSKKLNNDCESIIKKQKKEIRNLKWTAGGIGTITIVVGILAIVAAVN